MLTWFDKISRTPVNSTIFIFQSWSTSSSRSPDEFIHMWKFMLLLDYEVEFGLRVNENAADARKLVKIFWWWTSEKLCEIPTPTLH